MRFNRNKIETLLSILSDRLCVKGVKGQLFLVGGGAIAIAFNPERWTRDLDALFEPKSLIYSESKAIARENSIPEDWLNDAVKSFQLGEDPDATVFFDKPGLKVSVASPKCLLAMKLASSRVDDDVEDIRTLLTFCGYPNGIKIDEIVEDLVQRWPILENRWLPKAQYILQELLNELRPQSP